MARCDVCRSAHARCFPRAARAGDDRPIRVRERSTAGWARGRRGFGPGSMNAPKVGRHAPIPPQACRPDAGPTPDGRGHVRHAGRAGFGYAAWRVLVTLAILLVAVLVLSYSRCGGHRPCMCLPRADELGRDINRPRCPRRSRGSEPCRHAFNTMQSRLIRLIDDRTRILAAMSHDLKLPLPGCACVRPAGRRRTPAKFEGDLREMEAMVTATLEFMRGLASAKPRNRSTRWPSSKACKRERDMGRPSPSRAAYRSPTSGHLPAQALHRQSDRQRVNYAVVPTSPSRTSRMD